MSSFTLSIPPGFFYRFALDTIQRGPNDPLHIVDNAKLKRMFCIGDQSALFCISKEGDFLKVDSTNCLLSVHEQEQISAQVGCLFGLDDPLCRTYVEQGKLNYVSGVHGYFSIYEAAIQTIMGQLISAKAAQALRQRFIEQFGIKTKYDEKVFYLFPTPNRVKNLTLESLKNIGCSRTKAISILELSKAFADDHLDNILHSTSNAAQIQDLLTTFHGIGRWTSDWISLRGLRLFEVVPSGDLVIRKAFSWYLSSPILLESEAIDDYCKQNSPFPGSFAYRVMFAYQQTLTS